MYYYRILGAFLLAFIISQTIGEPNDRKLHKGAIPRSGGFVYFPILFFLFAFINAFEQITTIDLEGDKDDSMGYQFQYLDWTA
jgi:UDP-N-acetylmuramyl pentapeptide phosphotransferase/UDP-N-acetylglucosamine-1-phosphate transferase